MSQELVDMGTRKTFETGAMKEDTSHIGKGRYDLISPISLRKLAVICQAGAIKYDDRNWEKGIPICTLINSAIRHLEQCLNRETDESHDGQAMWNCMALVHTLAMIEAGKLPKELDDRPDYGIPLEIPVLNIVPKNKE